MHFTNIEHEGICYMLNQAGKQEELLGALIGLGREVEGNKNRPTKMTNQIMIQGLKMICADESLITQAIEQQISLLHNEKEKLVPRCLTCKKQCGRNNDYEIESFASDEIILAKAKKQLLEDILILANKYEIENQDVLTQIYDSLYLLGTDDALSRVQNLLQLNREKGWL